MAEVEYEVRNQIAYITLNRPEKLNAINPEMRELLWEAFSDVKQNPDVRVAILTGSGRAFSTGHDLEAMAAGRASEGKSTSELYLALQNIWKPILCAINGICLAQGCGLALSSDLRIASEDARFGWPQVKRGISSVSGPALMAQVVPRNVAFEIMFTAEFISAQRALDLHLVNQVVPAEDVMSTAEAFARKIMENAPLALAAIKEVTVLGSAMDLERRVAYAQSKADLTRITDDAKEGVRAFAEKRDPVWRGT
jgi:E-phenylitaconyl-CoA hydratase